MSTPKISIIIPNYNGKHFLNTCLNSLEKQTYQNFEIIVVDNGSNDSSVEFMRKNYPRVIIKQLKSNKGFSAAVNQGIRLVRGRYIFLLNNDTEVDKNCLAILSKVLDTKKDIGFCSTKMLYFDRRHVINNAGRISFSIYGVPTQRGAGEIDKGQYNKRELVFGACAGAAIYRRELFDQAGMLDKDFFIYVEDLDISFRAQLAGFKCLYVPEAVVYHVNKGTSGKLGNLAHFLTLRNSLYVIVKDFPLFLIIICSPFLILGRLVDIYRGLKLRRLRSIFQAYTIFFKSLPVLFKKRKVIQKDRAVSIKYLISILDKECPFSIGKFFQRREKYV